MAHSALAKSETTGGEIRVPISCEYADQIIAALESETARLQGERDAERKWEQEQRQRYDKAVSILQDEVAKATDEREQARERLRVMSEPVSDEEWAASQSEIVVPSHDFDPDDRYSVMFRDKVDALIKSRAALIGVEGQ